MVLSLFLKINKHNFRNEPVRLKAKETMYNHSVLGIKLCLGHQQVNNSITTMFTEVG